MKENTDLSNQLDAMVSQCQRINAGKIRMSFKRKDGYTIEITARRTEGIFDDQRNMESSIKDKYIILGFVGFAIVLISSIATLVIADSFNQDNFVRWIVFVCCNLLGWLLYLSFQTLIFDTYEIYKIKFGKKETIAEAIEVQEELSQNTLEFSDKELKYIKKSMIEKIGSESNKEAADMAFNIINVCQELLGEPQFESVDEIVSFNF